MTNNTAETLLSEEAQKEANSFMQSRRSEGGGPIASESYISRIQTLVMVLCSVIFVLGGALVYLVYQSNSDVATSSTPTVITTVDSAVSAGSIVVAKDNIAAGTKITPEHLALKEMASHLRPTDSLGASNAQTIVGQYASTTVLANAPITASGISPTPVNGIPFEIPAGHRATTINIDGRTGVEGFAKPGTYVDVLWYYSDDDDRQRVVTLVPRAKVLSVGGATENNTLEDENKRQSAGSMATILVTKKQAHSIELARNLGVLSLSLVGNTVEDEPEIQDLEVTLSDILKPDSNKGPSVNGVAVSYNPATGKREKFVLKNRGWVDGEKEESSDLVRARLLRSKATKAVPKKRVQKRVQRRIVITPNHATR